VVAIGLQLALVGRGQLQPDGRAATSTIGGEPSSSGLRVISATMATACAVKGVVVAPQTPSPSRARARSTGSPACTTPTSARTRGLRTAQHGHEGPLCVHA